MSFKHFVLNVDYKIRSDQVPTYLKYTSMDLNKSIIPIDLKFNLSLSSILGTLLYAIDSENNQLILSLYNNIKERIQIKFRGHDEYVHLKTLCGCEQCKYQWLAINVQIGNQNIQIKCNNGQIIQFKYKQDKIVLQDYPEKSKYLVIYFINTPEHRNGSPNNEQLEGCFKDAFLNGKSMHFESSPKDLTKCISSCANNVCNNGKCYDTFSENIICDCNNTFLNGQFCNSSMLNGPLRNETSKINQKSNIKLTWFSNSSKILFFHYTKFNFSIRNENGSILAEYQEKNSFLQIIKGTLLDTYKSFTNSTLYISFNTKSVHLKFHIHNISVSGEFAVPRNLSEENIISWNILEDNGGKIDIVYKNDPSDFTWNRAPITFPGTTKPPITTEPPVIVLKMKKVKFSWKVFYIALLIIEILLIIVSIIVWSFLCKHKKSGSILEVQVYDEPTPLLNRSGNNEKN